MSTRIVINPKFESLRGFIESIPSLTDEQLGEVLYKARNLVTLKEAGGYELVIKKFRVPNAINRLAYTTVRQSKARRSYDNAMQLVARQVLTPLPVAYIEERNGLLLGRSYYICLYTEGQNLRRWDLRDNAHELEEHLAKYMVELHAKGVWHKDFSPGNVIYDADYNFYLIDLNRMKFDVCDEAHRMHNFGAINIESRDAVLRLARLYARYRGDDEEHVVAQAAAMIDAYFARKARSKRLKKIIHLGRVKERQVIEK